MRGHDDNLKGDKSHFTKNMYKIWRPYICIRYVLMEFKLYYNTL